MQLSTLKSAKRAKQGSDIYSWVKATADRAGRGGWTGTWALPLNYACSGTF